MPRQSILLPVQGGHHSLIGREQYTTVAFSIGINGSQRRRHSRGPTEAASVTTTSLSRTPLSLPMPPPYDRSNTYPQTNP